MSATKAHLMSHGFSVAARHRADAAERRWRNLLAACALARGVDAATLDALTLDAAHDYAQAQELSDLAEHY